MKEFFRNPIAVLCTVGIATISLLLILAEVDYWKAIGG